MSQFDKVIGVVGVGGTGGGAAAVAVSSTKKLTEAFIGKNAKVIADGQGSSVPVKTGQFSFDFDYTPKKTTGINAKGGVSGSSNVSSLKSQGRSWRSKHRRNETTADGGDAANDPSTKWAASVDACYQVGLPWPVSYGQQPRRY